MPGHSTARAMTPALECLISPVLPPSVHQGLVHTEEGELPRGQQPAVLSGDVHGGEDRGLPPVADPGGGPDRSPGLVPQKVRALVCVT